MKSQLEREARLRNEAEAVIIREALREYFEAAEKKRFAAGIVLPSSTTDRLNEPRVNYGKTKGKK